MCVKLNHPAMMPKWLARDLILSWSNPRDTVIDPFAGSGTTGIEAEGLNRNSVLIEINPDYIDLIRGQMQPGPLDTGVRNIIFEKV
jgi:DNA modification methylase